MAKGEKEFPSRPRSGSGGSPAGSRARSSSDVAAGIGTGRFTVTPRVVQGETIKVDLNHILDQMPDRRPELKLNTITDVYVPPSDIYQPVDVEQWSLTGKLNVTSGGQVKAKNIKVSCATPFRVWPMRKPGQRVSPDYPDTQQGTIEWLYGPPFDANLIVTLAASEAPRNTASGYELHRLDRYPSNPLERAGGRLERFPTHPRLPFMGEMPVKEQDGDGNWGYRFRVQFPEWQDMVEAHELEVGGKIIPIEAQSAEIRASPQDVWVPWNVPGAPGTPAPYQPIEVVPNRTFARVKTDDGNEVRTTTAPKRRFRFWPPKLPNQEVPIQYREKASTIKDIKPESRVEEARVPLPRGEPETSHGPLGHKARSRDSSLIAIGSMTNPSSGRMAEQAPDYAKMIEEQFGKTIEGFHWEKVTFPPQQLLINAGRLFDPIRGDSVKYPQQQVVGLIDPIDIIVPDHLPEFEPIEIETPTHFYCTVRIPQADGSERMVENYKVSFPPYGIKFEYAPLYQPHWPPIEDPTWRWIARPGNPTFRTIAYDANTGEIKMSIIPRTEPLPDDVKELNKKYTFPAGQKYSDLTSTPPEHIPGRPADVYKKVKQKFKGKKFGIDGHSRIARIAMMNQHLRHADPYEASTSGVGGYGHSDSVPWEGGPGGGMQPLVEEEPQGAVGGIGISDVARSEGVTGPGAWDESHRPSSDIYRDEEAMTEPGFPIQHYRTRPARSPSSSGGSTASEPDVGNIADFDEYPTQMSMPFFDLPYYESSQAPSRMKSWRPNPNAKGFVPMSMRAAQTGGGVVEGPIVDRPRGESDPTPRSSSGRIHNLYDFFDIGHSVSPQEGRQRSSSAPEEIVAYGQVPLPIGSPSRRRPPGFSPRAPPPGYQPHGSRQPRLSDQSSAADVLNFLHDVRIDNEPLPSLEPQSPRRRQLEQQRRAEDGQVLEDSESIEEESDVHQCNLQ